jgi:integrase
VRFCATAWAASAPLVIRVPCGSRPRLGVVVVLGCGVVASKHARFPIAATLSPPSVPRAMRPKRRANAPSQRDAVPDEVSRLKGTRSVLSKVIAYAVDTGIRTDNPFAGLKSYRLGSYHTWTDAEIAQYERRWPLGTRERVAFALLLYTGQRGGDVVKMLRSDIVDGRIRVAQDKARKGTTNELLIPIHAALARALQAGPVVGMTHLITNTHGQPMQRQWLTKLISTACKAAGLPPRCKAHGLRKAALRRLAEAGSTTKQIAAVSGHRSLSEIERYTARADQAGLAQSAIAKLPDEDSSY